MEVWKTVFIKIATQQVQSRLHVQNSIDRQIVRDIDRGGKVVGRETERLS